LKLFWRVAYNILFLPLFWLAVHLAALWNSKVRRGVEGRRNLFENLEKNVQNLTDSKRIWIHSSSLGEFEQAKPIIEVLRQRNPSLNIIASFFSPSGFEHSRNYNHTSFMTYLPFDSPGNVKRFLRILKPDAAIFMRYDLWPNLIWQTKKVGVPIIVANAALGKRSNRQSFIAKSFLRSFYNDVDAILTISDEETNRYRNMGILKPDYTTVGESRFDQVLLRKRKASEKKLLPPAIIDNRKTLILGSTWREDEEVILPACRQLLDRNSELLLIVVPHEPNDAAIEHVESSLAPHQTIRYSRLNMYTDERIIIVDSVGILLPLYQYAHVVYIGGSFRQGIHNVMEPAVFDVPVIFGPTHLNSTEALALEQRKGGFCIKTSDEFVETVSLFLTDELKRKQAGTIAADYIKENLGASERCAGQILKYLKNDK
jgi:3-deoxy-D-manno-octulosonic-acid transferase